MFRGSRAVRDGCGPPTCELSVGGRRRSRRAGLRGRAAVRHGRDVLDSPYRSSCRGRGFSEGDHPAAPSQRPLKVRLVDFERPSSASGERGGGGDSRQEGSHRNGFRRAGRRRSRRPSPWSSSSRSLRDSTDPRLERAARRSTAPDRRLDRSFPGGCAAAARSIRESAPTELAAATSRSSTSGLSVRRRTSVLAFCNVIYHLFMAAKRQSDAIALSIPTSSPRSELDPQALLRRADPRDFGPHARCSGFADG